MGNRRCRLLKRMCWDNMNDQIADTLKTSGGARRRYLTVVFSDLCDSTRLGGGRWGLTKFVPPSLPTWRDTLARPH